MDSPNLRYVPAVDHLRLFAALMVLMVHGFDRLDTHLTPWPTPRHWPALLITEGYAGVSLFMVLSGFILTYAALGRHVSYGPFLRNRTLRLLPLFAVAFLISAAINPGSINGELLWITILPTKAFATAGFLGVAWSIFVEVQLYLIFPILLRHLEEGGPRRLMSFIALLAGIRFAALSAGADQHALLYGSVLSRADQFLLGMVAAWVLRRYGSRLWALAAPAGMALSLVLLSSFNHAGGPAVSRGSALGSHWAVLSPTAEGLGWALVVLGYVALMQGAAGAVTRGLARLGATSYSIYLLHFLVIDALLGNHFVLGIGRTPFTRAVLTAALVVVPVTLVVARMSYNLIELPFLRRRTRWIEPLQPAADVPLRVAS